MYGFFFYHEQLGNIIFHMHIKVLHKLRSGQPHHHQVGRAGFGAVKVAHIKHTCHNVRHLSKAVAKCMIQTAFLRWRAKSRVKKRK